MLKEYNIRDFKTFEKKQKLNTKYLRNKNIKLKLTFVCCIVYMTLIENCVSCGSADPHDPHGIQWVN